MLWTELDDLCDKLQWSIVGTRGIINLVDQNGPIYHAVSVHLSRAKIRRFDTFDDRYAVTKFSESGVWWSLEWDRRPTTTRPGSGAGLAVVARADWLQGHATETAKMRQRE